MKSQNHNIITMYKPNFEVRSKIDDLKQSQDLCENFNYQENLNLVKHQNNKQIQCQIQLTNSLSYISSALFSTNIPNQQLKQSVQNKSLTISLAYQLKQIDQNQNLCLQSQQQQKQIINNEQEFINSNSQIFQNQSKVKIVQNSLSIKNIKNNKLYGLSQGNDYIMKQKKKIYIWTQLQKIKFIAFLLYHSIDFDNSRKGIIKQCSEYVTKGNYQKIGFKIHGKKKNYTNLSYRQYAQHLIDKNQYRKEQITQEINKLIQYEKLKFQIFTTDQLENAQFINILSNYQPLKLDKEFLKVKLNKLDPYANLSNLQLKIIPFAQEKLQLDKKYLILAQFDLEFDVDESLAEFLQNFNHQQTSKVENSTKLTEQILCSNKSMLNQQLLWLQQSYENQLRQFQMLENVYKIIRNNKCNKMHEIKGGKKLKPLKKKLWTFQEHKRFLVFISGYKYLFENFQNYKLQDFKVMSNYIKTKNYYSCYDHFYEVTKRYENINLLLQGEIKIYKFNQSQFQEEVKRIIKRNCYRRRFAFNDNKFDIYKIKVKQNSLNEENKIQLSIKKIKKMQIQIRLI